MGDLRYELLVLVFSVLMAAGCVCIILIFARLLINQSDAVVQWHQKEVENQDLHREKLELKFDKVECDVKHLLDVLRQKSGDGPDAGGGQS